MKTIVLLSCLLFANLTLAQHNSPLLSSEKTSSLVSDLVTGTVTDETGTPLSGINIFAQANFSEAYSTTGNDGSFSIDLSSQSYIVYAAGWGYLTKVINYNVDDQELNFILPRGYVDSFFFDNNWNVSGDAETGTWTRDEPIGTNYNDWPCNPGSDSAADELGNVAYITGNLGGGAGNDDVDNGTSILRSPPMDLTNMNNPRITFDLWFFNDGGQGMPDDNISVSFISGTDKYEAAIYDKSFPVWFPQALNPEEFLSDLSQVVIEFEVSDFDGTGHLVEAGVDNFRVYEGSSIVSELPFLNYTSSPNPFNDQIQISYNYNTIASFIITDLNGKVIMNKSNVKTNEIINTTHLQAGVYFIQVFGNGFQSQVQKIIKI